MLLIARLLFMLFWLLVFMIGVVTVDWWIMGIAVLAEVYLVIKTSRKK